MFCNGTVCQPEPTFVKTPVSNINGGTGAENVIPGEMTADFNFRFCTEVTDIELKSRTESVFQAHGLEL